MGKPFPLSPHICCNVGWTNAALLYEVSKDDNRSINQHHPTLMTTITDNYDDTIINVIIPIGTSIHKVISHNKQMITKKS